MNVLTFDVALAHKLKKAFAKTGWTETEINKLAESDQLEKMRWIVRGKASVMMHKLFIPDGYEIEEHEEDIRFDGDFSKIELYFTKMQAEGEYGEKVRENLKGKHPCNANVLDYLLANPRLIPKKWKDTCHEVCFWGTIYRQKGGSSVRCLRNIHGSGWTHGIRALCHNWFDGSAAAVHVE